MKRTRRQYQDGENIFRQGELGEAAYVVIEGTVELERLAADGARQVKTLRAGQMFGESAIVQPGPRDASARAVGPVVVKMLERDDRPKAAAAAASRPLAGLGQILSKLVRGASARAERPVANRPGPLALARRLFARAPAHRGQAVKVLVAPFAGEAGEAAARHVVDSFGGVPRLQARLLARPLLAAEPARDPAERRAAEIEAARQKMRELDADAVIVGEAPSDGFLRLIGIGPKDDDEVPLPASAAMPLSLPSGFGAELSPLLHAVVLAVAGAAEPRHPGSPGPGIAPAREALAAALEAAQASVQNLPREMGPRERAAAHFALGAIAARVAQMHGTPESHRAAATAFAAAAEQLARDRAGGAEGSVSWALAQTALGAELTSIAERAGDATAWADAEKALEAALTVLTREGFPREWAAAQNRLGLALFRRGFEGGDTATVTRAVAAFQSTLQVYGRTEFPLRWAEAMNNVAQAAQVLGELLRSDEVLAKAAEACRQALEVRTREAHPLLWAASQNNLGSALFLLGKATHQRAKYEEAEAAFAGAHEAYMARGAERLAAVCQKNLNRVRRMLEATAPKPQRLAWFEEEEEGTEPRSEDRPAPRE